MTDFHWTAKFLQIWFILTLYIRKTMARQEVARMGSSGKPSSGFIVVVIAQIPILWAVIAQIRIVWVAIAVKASDSDDNCCHVNNNYLTGIALPHSIRKYKFYDVSHTVVNKFSNIKENICEIYFLTRTFIHLWEI